MVKKNKKTLTANRYSGDAKRSQGHDGWQKNSYDTNGGKLSCRCQT